MNGIHRKIKQIRATRELTQSFMADKLSISLKAYQNFENGVSKLDFERLKEVAEILEMEVEDLINAEDSGVYIAEIKNNRVGYNGSEVTINESESRNEKVLFQKIIDAKDEQIALLTNAYNSLMDLLNKLTDEK